MINVSFRKTNGRGFSTAIFVKNRRSGILIEQRHGVCSQIYTELKRPRRPLVVADLEHPARPFACFWYIKRGKVAHTVSISEQGEMFLDALANALMIVAESMA